MARHPISRQTDVERQIQIRVARDTERIAYEYLLKVRGREKAWVIVLSDSDDIDAIMEAEINRQCAIYDNAPIVIDQFKRIS